MTDTPRTDFEVRPAGTYVYECQVVYSDFARTLERELSAARAQLADLEEKATFEIRRLRDESLKQDATIARLRAVIVELLEANLRNHEVMDMSLYPYGRTFTIETPSRMDKAWATARRETSAPATLPPTSESPTQSHPGSTGSPS